MYDDSPIRDRTPLGHLLGGVRMGIAVIVACGFALPVFLMILGAFKTEAEIQAIPPVWWPENFPSFFQFVAAAEIAPLWRYLFNSLFVSLSNVVVTCFFGALAGYGFARYRFPGREVLFFVITATMMIPFQVLVVPLFVQVHAFGWADSYAGLIVPGIMNAFGVFMMRQYCEDLPQDIIDAARVDGAGEFGLFIRIILPLLKPPLASLAIIIFIWSWGNFLWPLVVTQSRDLTVLAVGLTSYSEPINRAPMWGAAMAASTVATLPILVLFVAFQRNFVRGLTAAAVKG